MSTAPRRPPILERAAELRALEDALVRASAGSGRLVVVEGEAGIGKSTLLQHAIAAAPGVGLRALQARGSELEREYSCGIAVDLFSTLLRDRRTDSAELFNGPAAPTAELFGVQLEAAASPSGDPFATIHGLYWLAMNAADRGPLLLVIDDAQWADEASLRFLHYLAQRADELPIVIVAAFRTGEGAEGEIGQLLRGGRHAIYLRPQPLSEDAVGDLLAALGAGRNDVALRRACRDATGGNPFLVTEVIWELSRTSLEPASGISGEVAGLVPERVRRFVASRLARLDPVAQRFAEAVAILSETANLRIAASLAKLSEDAAVDVARSLVRAAILGAGATLSFTHPIVRSVIYDSIPPVARARLHREAALSLQADGVPIGVVAAQLLEAERAGDAHVVDWLAEAAREAASRGDPIVAARLLRRALDEPPPSVVRTALLIQLARAEAAAGVSTAVERYNEVLQLVDDSRRRASLLLELGYTLITAGQWPPALEVFERGLREPGATDPAVQVPLEAGYLSACRVTMVRSDEIRARVARILESRSLGPAERELAVWVAFHLAASVSARATDMLSLVKRAIADVPIETLVTERQLVEVAAGVLLDTDELELELDFLSRAMDAAERGGPLAKIGVYSYCRAWPNYFTGRLTDAIADAQAALHASEVGWEAFVPATATVLAQALIERGDLDAADEILRLDPARWGQRLDFVVMTPIARGRLAMASGDMAAAIAEFRQAAESSAKIGQRLQVPSDWRIWLAIALSQAGERDEARRVAAEAVEIAREWGARWPLGAALRAAGIAEGGSAGIALLREARAELDGSPALLERTRLLVDLGAALRRQGSLKEARAVLTEGMDLAHRIGATALVERSRADLRAAGLRPRRYAVTGIDALTPAETRVATLATSGRTNRQIAQSLFVTPKAVEYHLANAYRKLGIASRQELAQALARDEGDDLGAVGHPRRTGAQSPAAGTRSNM